MDLKYTVEEEEFRREVRAWIAENLPEEFKVSSDGGLTATRQTRVTWYKRLAEKGWLCQSWPEAAGGPGWTLAQQVIFTDEAAALGAPNLDMGAYMVGPLLIEYGTEEQKKRYLPKITSADELWCQGYSEPNAGSDLASLALRADRDGDDYVLNGQKIWTSGADQSDMIFILVRTNPHAEKKQTGISFLVAPMDTPGIRINPIQQITGDSHFFETFFTDARVPVANLIGKENEGWTLAKRLLAHERAGLGSARLFRRTLTRLCKLAQRTSLNGVPAVQDHSIRQRLAKLAMELDALGATDNRGLTRLLHGHQPGPESSIAKLFGSELFQRMTDLALEIQGPLAQLWDDEPFKEKEDHWSKTAVGSRGWSIFSGTSEIQRNIISERVLGLPR
ncbi:acyl-CoA dehydrogenase family protein [Candidatus Sumerlaeota bacterium]|nr:acyl-CoA dehydrogenase family protein [Candidatus Sumerlaeota bacterium]